MATLKDIAQLAGVSHGTVSNVLNGKGNVSVEKIKLVEDAARQLGYSINAQARQLRGPSVLANIIAVIVPDITETKYACFFQNIKRHYEKTGTTVLLFVTEDVPYLEQSAVTILSTMRAKGVISVTCCPNYINIYAPVKQYGATVLFAERKPAGEELFIGFDYFKIGTEIGDFIRKNNFHSAGLLRHLNLFSSEADMEAGISASLEETGDISFKVVESNIQAALRASFDFLSDNALPDVIVTTGCNFLNHIKTAYSLNAKELPALITLSPKGYTVDSGNFINYALNYDNLGYQAAVMLDRHLDGHTPHAVKICCFPADGIHSDYTFPGIRKEIQLNFLTIKGQATDALLHTLPQFERESGIKVHFIALPPNELYDTISQKDSGEFFDLFRVNMFHMPIFPHNKFLPLHDDFFHEMTENMIPKVVKEFSYIDQTPYAIPLDIGTQILIYRKDLFEDPMIKRMYYEMNTKTLQVPSDFEEFNEIARFFTRKYNPNSPVHFGTSSSLTTNLGICTNFEIRYRGFGGTACTENETLLLDDPVFYAAMQNYKDSFLYAEQTYDNYWGGDNIQNFINGSTAMEIIFSNYASGLASLNSSKIGGRIGCAVIPGNKPALGGGSLSISSSTKEPEAAQEFIHWACGINQAETHTMLGGLSPYPHIFENRRIINLYPWHLLLNEAIDTCTGRSIFNRVNSIEYEHLAGSLIRNIVNQTITPEEGLNTFKQNIRKCMIKE